jgi:uncharacterized lipoprotein YmbA
MGKVNERDEAMMKNVVGCCLWFICVLNIGGCANTQPTHFYLLRAMNASSSPVLLEANNSGMSLGLGPIRFPKYLDRPQIVTRISAHEIDLAEFHKWAEPLKENVTNVLQENLSALLATDGIVLYPWNRAKLPDYQLSLDVIQLDGTKNQEAELTVRWTIMKKDGKHILQKMTSQFSEVVQGSEYEDLVEAMSRMLATFSQEIADAIQARILGGSENS